MTDHPLTYGYRFEELVSGKPMEYFKSAFIDAHDEDEPYIAARRLLASMYKVVLLRHLGQECRFTMERLTRDEYPEEIAAQARYWGHDTDDSAAMTLRVEAPGAPAGAQGECEA